MSLKADLNMIIIRQTGRMPFSAKNATMLAPVWKGRPTSCRGHVFVTVTFHVIESRVGVVFVCLFLVDLLAVVVRGEQCLNLRDVYPGGGVARGRAQLVGLHSHLFLLPCSSLAIRTDTTSSVACEPSVFCSGPHTCVQTDKSATGTTFSDASIA